MIRVLTPGASARNTKMLPEHDPKSQPAYAGFSVKGRTPQENISDFIFSQPFCHHARRPLVPERQRMDRIKDDKAIFVDNGSDRVLRYGQLKSHTLALASGLQALGLHPDDTQALPATATCASPEIAPIVLLQLPNCLVFPTALMGVFAAGLTATLASPALTSGEIAWILQNSRPRIIITASPDAVKEAIELQEDQEYFRSVKVFHVDVATQYPNITMPKSPSDWTSLLKVNPRPLTKPKGFNAANRTAVILWSSGTSGKSKGVLLSHSALVFGTVSVWFDADFYQLISQRWLAFAPFYHVFGLMNILTPAIATGSTAYCMTGFKLDIMLQAIKNRRITYLHMAPPIGIMLAKSPLVEDYAKMNERGENGFSSLAGATTGGAPLGHEVIVEVFKRCGFRIKMGYGLTEAGGATLQYGLTEESLIDGAGDTGQPLWGVELMIADPGNQSSASPKPTTVDTPGEILIRSPFIMSAYLPLYRPSPASNDMSFTPDMSTTSEALTPDGWFRTGDVGTLSLSGALRITDRLKELIKVRAYQVAPAELEAILCSSDHVADAGVIATYDADEATEWPRAFVVPQGQKRVEMMSPAETKRLAETVKAIVEEKAARYKWLRGGVVFVNQIPKSPSGKILRRVMKTGLAEKGIQVELYQSRKATSKL